MQTEARKHGRDLGPDPISNCRRLRLSQHFFATVFKCLHGKGEMCARVRPKCRHVLASLSWTGALYHCPSQGASLRFQHEPAGEGRASRHGDTGSA
jgi:hypothetical protein